MTEGEKPTLADVYNLLTDAGFRDPEGGIAYEMAMLGGPARSAAALLTQSAEETVGGIMANVFSHMKWLESQAMREMLSASDFSALDINNGRTSVYFVLPPELLGVHQRPLRLIVSTFVAAALKGRKAKGKDATLLIFNECYALGALEILTKAAALLRGYGARAAFFFQNYGQARELYGANAETFFANSGQVQVLGVNDLEGAQYVSDKIGKTVLWRKRETRDKNGNVTMDMEPAGSASLRDGPEVSRTTGRAGRLQIVLNEGSDAFLLRRTSYRKIFKRSEYGRDPYEPRRETLREMAMRILRGAVVKFKEWRQ
jgi:type IV secretory pathway TraG/TraD family ATPase VirD4